MSLQHAIKTHDAEALGWCLIYGADHKDDDQLDGCSYVEDDGTGVREVDSPEYDASGNADRRPLSKAVGELCEISLQQQNEQTKQGADESEKGANQRQNRQRILSILKQLEEKSQSRNDGVRQTEDESLFEGVMETQNDEVVQEFLADYYEMKSGVDLPAEILMDIFQEEFEPVHKRLMERVSAFRNSVTKCWLCGENEAELIEACKCGHKFCCDACWRALTRVTGSDKNIRCPVCNTPERICVSYDV